ncbi:MAG: hypothetical protein PHY47_07830 [Lachnospiraceae bacterium]|nr:hypothetical protein [Lachnospiraceae bacterium]
MDTERYWNKFEHSGQIKDYMSYKNDDDVKSWCRSEEELGDLGSERFCACDRHCTKDKQSG